MWKLMNWKVQLIFLLCDLWLEVSVPEPNFSVPAKRLVAGPTSLLWDLTMRIHGKHLSQLTPQCVLLGTDSCPCHGSSLSDTHLVSQHLWNWVPLTPGLVLFTVQILCCDFPCIYCIWQRTRHVDGQARVDWVFDTNSGVLGSANNPPQDPVRVIFLF